MAVAPMDNNDKWAASTHIAAADARIETDMLLFFTSTTSSLPPFILFGGMNEPAFYTMTLPLPSR